MSGGSLDYVYQDVEQAKRRARLEDDEADLLDDVAELLHDFEWSLSGDYAREQYRQTLREFAGKWDGGYREDVDIPTDSDAGDWACDTHEWLRGGMTVTEGKMATVWTCTKCPAWTRQFHGRKFEVNYHETVMAERE